jgi:phosphatidylinositol phospholipase C delta
VVCLLTRHIQICALNWQTFDLALQLNEALFSGHGGWVLKPPSLRAEPGQEPEKSKRGGKVKMELEIVGGSELPMPEDAKKQGHLQPYVVVELLTSKGEYKKTEVYKKRKDDEHQGRNARWEERLTFEWEDEELVFIR